MEIKENLKLMAHVLRLEAKALTEAARLLEQEGESSVMALTKLYRDVIEKNATLFFSGVGKSGIMAKKMAATFTSLGRPSFFLHPVEALHGDLGAMKEDDLIIFISKSGTTEELLKLIPFLKIPKERRVLLSGPKDSPLAKCCQIYFNADVEKEACLNNQAPTTSTTVALGLGDAMAVLYEKMVGLSSEGFAVNHPGGFLGKSLLMKVENLMIKREDCPLVSPDDSLQDILLKMTAHPVSAAIVEDQQGRFFGLIVEGDIRRTLTKFQEGLKVQAALMANRAPVSIAPDAQAITALEVMEGGDRKFQLLPVIDENGFFKGLIRLQELVKAGLKK